MPHALFLGSSLAGIDRLDMMPRPPVPETRSTKSLKMPSFGLPRRLNRQTAVTPIEEETIEMKSYQPANETDNVHPNGPCLDDDVIAQLDRAESRSHQDHDYDAAVKKYEADLKAFDRIRWTDLHIRHATVSTDIPSKVSSKC